MYIYTMIKRNIYLNTVLFCQLLISCSCGQKINQHKFQLVPPIASKNVVQFSGIEPPIQTIDPNSKSGQNNLSPPKKLTIILTFREESSGEIKKIFSGEGSIQELDLSGVPDGTYIVTTEINGNFRPPPPQKVHIANEEIDTFNLNFEKITNDNFYYYWESDHFGREFEYSANENVDPIVVVLNENVNTSLTTASKSLNKDYNIILDNQDQVWPYDIASRLLKTINSLPHNKLPKKSRFILTQRKLNNDIEFKNNKGHWTVTLSIDAFIHASKKLVKLNGKKGYFFSKRLFQALVHFFTNNGHNRQAINKILLEKFGVTTEVPDYNGLTGESKHNFQQFHFNELIKIINAFAEMPSGYYKISGLRYLIRRQDGHPHPLYPEAAAVAWPRGAKHNSYIEFMDTAFLDGNENDSHRLILHEKSHFLWTNIFSQEIKDDWINLGQWFPNQKAASGWSTYDTTAFVSPYAHAKNPNEDMAESLAFYVLNPNKLLSIAPKKFNFIEDRIMNGYRYVSQMREDLTFEVFNLFPDYDFPGKIRKVEVLVKGDPYQDKHVTITLGLTNNKNVNDSASRAYTRLTSPEDTFKDISFVPVNGDGHLLKGTITIPKNAKSGYWTIQNITITDHAGNERMEGIVDFGFKLYINNEVEDTIPPKYVSNSINITSKKDTRQGKQIFHINTSWKIEENMAMKSRYPVHTFLVSVDYPELYRIENSGTFNENNNIGQTHLILTEFHPPGRYGVSYLHMKDKALNLKGQYFSDNPKHEPIKTVYIETRNPDYQKPTLDTERIYIQANPTNPTSPDGSTNVEIVFYAKDDKSGLGIVSYILGDPLGKRYFKSFIHSNTYTLFFKGDPTTEKEYRTQITLPKGSPPGKWGLLEVTLQDKAGNVNTYNFLETMHFEVLQ